ncbi:MAG: AAA domain-containing protein [Agriterribacter sp.]
MTTQRNRPYFNETVQALEAIFYANDKDYKTLNELFSELSHRDTQRAGKLKELVIQAMAILNNKGERKTTDTKEIKPLVTHNPKKSSMEENVLSAWIAFEILSPQSFKRPQDLAANGDIKLVASFHDKLPWEGTKENSKPNYKLFYQVIIGTVNIEGAISKLLDVYGDTRIEKPPVKGEAILAVLVVDKNGVPIDNGAVSISSFGWGVVQALKGDLTVLSAWPEAEKKYLSEIDMLIRRYDNEGHPLPIDRGTLALAFNHLVNTLSIPEGLASKKQFAIRNYEYFKNPEPPQPLLLNSFFLNDLLYARSLFNSGKAPGNLVRYIKQTVLTGRVDLLNSNAELEQVLAPLLFSPGRWPAGENALVLMQQAAVNLAFKELKQNGILGVNGPPGTGKTTILRDIVASIITERAKVMCSFSDPAEAFTHSGQKTRAGTSWLHIYELDDRLKGFEILIASSNNKAVENVSAELPGIDAIKSSNDTPRYFKSLSDKLIDKNTWGLISAVLGNMANRSKFRQTFWWDTDDGLSTYLAEITGIPQEIDIIDEKTKQVIGKRKPNIIAEEKPPESHEDALIEWESAKKDFEKAINQSETRLHQLALVRTTLLKIKDLENEERLYKLSSNETNDLLQEISNKVLQSEQAIELINNQVNKFGLQSLKHKSVRPNWLKMLFNTGLAKIWKQENSALNHQIEALTKLQQEALKKATEAKDNEKMMLQKLNKLKTELGIIQQKIKDASLKIQPIRKEIELNIIDDALLRKKHDVKHLTMPWCDANTQKLRDEVFKKAMNIHKAFLNACAKPMRHNLGTLMYIFSGKGFDEVEKQLLITDLWSSLFLVVPCFSSTFASVDRMFGKLPEEAIGWLLIDEAGQAVPQAAVGAILRSKRCIVVGDPSQVEPVVTLPETLTWAICKSFAVDGYKYNAPNASVQTLSDTLAKYYGDLPTTEGSKSIGVPLLVHRRCNDPMFTIANNIAYSRQMVQAKIPKESLIRNCLGDSKWIDIRSQSSSDKWSPEEGKIVMGLLGKIKAAGVKPDVYIITPFVIVAENIRTMITDSGILTNWVENSYSWCFERVGTIHTVQGREAEAVIFILGAPDIAQNGARNWAGKKPNLLNVAVTRAKEVIYVVGNKELWSRSGFFAELSKRT